MSDCSSKGSCTDLDYTATAVNQSLIENLQNCPGVAMDQEIDVTGDFNTIKNTILDQSASVQSDCFFTAENQQELQNQIVNNMVAATLQASVSYLGGLVSGGAYGGDIDESAIVNAVNKSTTRNIQNCAGVAATQGIDIDGNFNRVSGVVESQDINAYLSCFFSASNHTSMSNDLQNAMSASQGLASKKSAKSSIGGIITMALVALIVVGIVVVMVKEFGGKKSAPTAVPRQ